MELETAGQELVKCVLVGDTAVGKTRLICARAKNEKTSLPQLMSTHVPTVWAIDQYRMYKDVLENSMANVDGVQVSLRLWDTFGDHEKDRRFAYGRSDIILLCFSLGSRSSLQHCKTMWYPEIRRFCPDTPVILVGCKNDLRFLCRDPKYLAYCRDRSPFQRPTRESDIVMPEQARIVASELGLPYYETSVFTYHGVNQVFDNAIRAALISRRNQRFWMTNLKHVQQPLLQAPYCPASPMKELGAVEIFPGNYWGDIKSMFTSECFPDVVFVKGSTEIPAHMFVLAAATPEFAQSLEVDEMVSLRRNSETSTASDSTVDDTECLLKKNGSSCLAGLYNSVFSYSSETDFKEIMKPKRVITAPYTSLIISDHIRLRDSVDNSESVQIVVQLKDQVSVEIVRAHLYFLYTGELPEIICATENFRAASKFFMTPGSIQTAEASAKPSDFLKKAFRRIFRQALWEKGSQNYRTDVVFHLDDGQVPAHRAILMARSDVMRAMFSGDFKERRSHCVSLPGVKKEVFRSFLEYLYTDALSPPVPLERGMSLVELANRLCLPRLINIIEKVLIEEIAQKQSQGLDMIDDCMKIIEPAQLHNAEQLARWCLRNICEQYDTVCRKHSKTLKELAPENRQFISENRWPPVWYVKEFDYYQKALVERYKMENREKGRKRNNSGCLCFSSKSRRDDTEEKAPLPKSN